MVQYFNDTVWYSLHLESLGQKPFSSLIGIHTGVIFDTLKLNKRTQLRRKTDPTVPAPCIPPYGWKRPQPPLRPPHASPPHAASASLATANSSLPHAATPPGLLHFLPSPCRRPSHHHFFPFPCRLGPQMERYVLEMRQMHVGKMPSVQKILVKFVFLPRIGQLFFLFKE